jgi:hypothetical protein
MPLTQSLVARHAQSLALQASVAATSDSNVTQLLVLHSHANWQ